MSTICLCMIVKDEAHIIEETLERVSKYISSYAISDTGSSDNTIEIIENFFKKKDIPGKVYQDEWEDFGHNRSVALSHCKNKSDYI